MISLKRTLLVAVALVFGVLAVLALRSGSDDDAVHRSVRATPAATVALSPPPISAPESASTPSGASDSQSPTTPIPPEPAGRGPLASGPLPSRGGASHAPPGDAGSVAVSDPRDDGAPQTVTVLGSDHKPVADALVSIRVGKGPLLKRRRTEADGTFTITAAELEGSGRIARHVWIRHARWGRQSFTVSPDEPAATIVLAKAGALLVAGKIRATRGDVPRDPSLLVRLSFLTTKFTASDFTRWDPATGDYAIELVPADRFIGPSAGRFVHGGAYDVVARAAGFCDAEAVLHPPARPVDFTLEPECVVRGSLTLPVGYENEPGAVEVESASFEIEHEKATGIEDEARPVRLGDGHTFELAKLHPGWVRVRASVGSMVGAWGTVQLTDGAVVESFTLHVDPSGWNVPTTEVTGKVVDTDGAPIAECTIVTDGARAETLEDGSFVFRLTEGRHELRPAADGYAPPQDHPGVVVRPGVAVKPLKITLESLDGPGD